MASGVRNPDADVADAVVDVLPGEAALVPDVRVWSQIRTPPPAAPPAPTPTRAKSWRLVRQRCGPEEVRGSAGDSVLESIPPKVGVLPCGEPWDGCGDPVDVCGPALWGVRSRVWSEVDHHRGEGSPHRALGEGLGEGVFDVTSNPLGTPARRVDRCGWG